MVLGMKPPLTVPLLYAPCALILPMEYEYKLTHHHSPLLSQQKPAMVLKIKAIILLLLFLLLPLSSGSFEGFKHGLNSCNSFYKTASLMKMRKILMYEVQDYDDTMANTKHDPKKRPGSRKP